MFTWSVSVMNLAKKLALRFGKNMIKQGGGGRGVDGNVYINDWMKQPEEQSTKQKRHSTSGSFHVRSAGTSPPGTRPARVEE